MVTLDVIRNLINAELGKVVDPARRDALQAILVPPQTLRLDWAYGKPNEQYDCWLVGLSPDGRERLVYCEQGFGPGYPWGFVSVDQNWLGMDSQWHVGLEHVAIGLGILPAPDNYEVP